MRETIDLDHRYLQQIRERIAIYLRGWPVRVYLFGSRAAGKARTGSDCDIGIDPMQDLPVGLLSRLREALEESQVPYNFEIIDLSQVDEEFALNVRSEGVLWIDTSKSCNQPKAP